MRKDAETTETTGTATTPSFTALFNTEKAAAWRAGAHPLW